MKLLFVRVCVCVFDSRENRSPFRYRRTFAPPPTEYPQSYPRSVAIKNFH